MRGTVSRLTPRLARDASLQCCVRHSWRTAFVPRGQTVHSGLLEPLLPPRDRRCGGPQRRSDLPVTLAFRQCQNQPRPEHIPRRERSRLCPSLQLFSLLVRNPQHSLLHYYETHPECYRYRRDSLLVTQDCDLDWDFRARQEQDETKKLKAQSKLLPNLLFCEVAQAEELRGVQTIASDIWRRVKQNQDERYHYLPAVPSHLDAVTRGFSDLAIDFKRVFSIPTEEMYKRLSLETRRRTILQGPFMQDLSNRFAYYHLRVALPTIGQSVSNAQAVIGPPVVSAV